MSTKPAALLLLSIAACAGVAYAVASSRPDVPSADAPQPVSLRMTIEGSSTCLVPMEGAGPQDQTCVLGVVLDDGSSYALDGGDLDPASLSLLGSGEPVRATGLMVPLEAISSNAWAGYEIRGIMRVESVEKPR